MIKQKVLPREYNHFKRRAKERWFADVTDKELLGVVKEIKKGKAHFVDRQSTEISRFMCSLRGEERVVVWDDSRNLPVTVLPEGSDLSKGGWKVRGISFKIKTEFSERKTLLNSLPEKRRKSVERKIEKYHAAATVNDFKEKVNNLEEKDNISLLVKVLRYVTMLVEKAKKLFRRNR